MKMIQSFLFSVSALLIVVPAHAKVVNAKVVNAKVAVCVAGKSAFEADKCQGSKGAVKCDFELVKSFGGKFVVGAHIDGAINSKGSIGGAYSSSWLKNGNYVTRREVNFGGLNRGMVQLVENDKGIVQNVLALEVYINHNSRGTKYTRYSCGTVKKNL
jgi:hypothetical protein